MKHKWHDEIVAWARGERLQWRVGDIPWRDWEISGEPPTTPGFCDKNMEFRIAPKTRRVTMESGDVVEWPEPMREAPEKRSRYWFPLSTGSADSHCWQDDAVDDHNLKSGLCHATQEAAEQHAEALRKINGAVG